MDQNQLKKIVYKCLERENFSNFQIDLTGASGVADGYLGDINFVKVNATKRNGDETTVDLAIKCMKIGEALTELTKLFLNMYFNQEIVVYSKVFPLFRQFEEEKGIRSKFEAVPKCYKCFEDEQIIVLENLKTLGYVVRDRKVPLKRDHLELVLEEFGKFHALSFAMKDQKEEEFADLVHGIKDIDEVQFKYEFWYGMFTTSMATLQKILKQRNYPELLSQLDKFLDCDFIKESKKLLDQNTGCQVVCHVDTWNNNMMFLYEQNSIKKLKIIDWQMMNIRNSPIYDIAHFLYTCSSPDDLNQLEQLLKVYYNSFSKYLRQLGSNPEKLFSFNMLKEHWKKFSAVAFIYVPYVIKQSFWNEEDAPVLSEGGVDDWNTKVDQIVIRNEEYYVRLIGVVKHFFNYKFID